jgi:hypothetical protein
MKHPIIYRFAIYSIISILCFCVMHIVSMLNYAPFTSSNMRDSFYVGCNLGFHNKLSIQSIDRCQKLSNDYKSNLDDLDKEMNNAQ